jgi:hypothetical protein
MLDSRLLNVYALHDATQRGDIEAVQALLAAGADVNIADMNGVTALHEAAIDGNIAAIQVLIAARANMSVTDQGGNTPLNYTLMHGHSAAAEVFIEAGANIHAANNCERTPIIIAFESGCHDTVRLLEARGAVLPEYLREQPEEAGINFNRGQSTHTASVHESISESALKLREHYRTNGLQAARVAALAWLENATLDNLNNEFLRKLETAQKLLPELLESNDINLSSSTGALKALQLDFLRNDLPDFSNLGKSEAQDCLNTFIERHHNEQLEIQRTHFLPKLEAAKRCLPRILDSTFIDARSEISTPDAIGLVWLGLHCPDIQNPDNDSINRLIIFVNHLYEIQRGYNLNTLGEDDKKDDDNICEAGAFNKLIDTLNGVHPDIQILVVTSATIRFKAQALVNTLCERLSANERLAYAKLWMANGKPPKALLDFLRAAILAELDSEFGSFKKNIANYEKIVSDFLGNLKDIEPPKCIVTSFQEHQGSSSSSAMPDSEVHAGSQQGILMCFRQGQQSIRDENLNSSDDSSDDEQSKEHNPKRPKP